MIKMTLTRIASQVLELTEMTTGQPKLAGYKTLSLTL